MDPSLGSDVPLRVDAPHVGARLDAFLRDVLGVGRRAAKRLASSARVNGRASPKGRPLRLGDEIVLSTPPDAPPGTGEDPRILRVDPSVLVLHKPSGLPSVSLAGSGGASLAAWLSKTHAKCASIGRPGECGLVHRLDNGTSGLLLAARTDTAYDRLRDQFDRHAVEKTYLAIVAGHIDGPRSIRAAIGAHRKSRTRVRAFSGEVPARYAAREAETEVTPIRSVGPVSVVSARTTTGARHQIRVHLAHAGHPLIGDEKYGGPAMSNVPTYLLHASALRWTDPESGGIQSAEAPPPTSWKRLLDRWENEPNTGFPGA